MSAPLQQPFDIVGANRSAEAVGEPPAEPIVTRLVDGVVKRLTLVLPGDAHVEELPDRPKEYDLGKRRAVVLVHYRGSKYRAPNTNGAMVQARAMSVDVHILVRGLGGTSRGAEPGAVGAYDLVEAVRLALQGHTIEGCGPFIMLEDGVIGEDGGVWNYVVQFAAGTRAVSQAPLRRPDVPYGGFAP